MIDVRSLRLPPREAPGRLFLTRFIAIVALAVTVAYLVWRATATVNWDGWYVGVPMLLLEVHAAVGLALFAFSLWDIDRRPPLLEPNPDLTVAVLIPTYNEGREILLPTIAAAVALEPAHETWVLDDGDRPEVRRMAESLGARYLARPTHEHAKAGNVNHALGVVQADLLAILDADHVARADFLRNTLGYFRDPRVAVVQTPQEFYNVTSFEHGRGRTFGEHFHEQTLFYRLIQPGKNRWNAAFWCGTNAVVRAAAVREVGGCAVETITEDIHTTIRLHRAGWKSVYHNEVLARGLAADNAAQYQLQRNRWGTGAMQVLKVENPLIVPGLSFRQRLAYASTLLGWFDAWRTLGFLLLPAAVLLTGQIPILADGLTFALFFGATYALQQLALYRLGRGAYRPVLSILFELVRMTPNLRATLTLITTRVPRFAVTPKGRTGEARGRVPAPAPLRAVLAISFVALVVFALSLLGALPITYPEPWAAWGACAWLVVNAGLVWLAIRRVRSLRFAGERRAGVRFAVDTPGSVDGIPAGVQDISVGGTLLATRERLVERDRHLVTFGLPEDPISLWATVRSVREAPSGELHYAFEFVPGQDAAAGDLARAIFGADFPVAGTSRVRLTDLLRSDLAGLSRRFRHQERETLAEPVRRPLTAPPEGA
ncbi:MAG TPA: glycosyltransferase [Candidatus Limnocylindria bacterium]|nr:glycosyltransferase [Candidatus Limnocylindria bacterium]